MLAMENRVLSALPVTSSMLAVGCLNGTIHIQEHGSQATMEQFGPVNAIAKLTDDMFATSDRGQICLWDIDGKKKLRAFGPEASASISSMVGFPTGMLAVVRQGAKSVEIWDTNSGKLKQSLNGHDVEYIAKLSHNRLASYACDKKIRIWNILTGKCERVIENVFAYSLSALSNDTLVTSDLQGIKLWTTDGKCVKDIKMDDFMPWVPLCAAVTPDDKLLINARKTAFRALDLEASEKKDVYGCSPSDLIVCMDDGTVVTFGPGRTMTHFESI
jgi:WD40 repeat protein